jgi:hypothetical protein
MSKRTALEMLRNTNGSASFEDINKAARVSIADYKAAVMTYQEELSLAQDELPEDLLDMVAGGTGFSRVREDEGGDDGSLG